MTDARLQKPMPIAALGRPFMLGMLYDCRNDKLIPGITLWDKDKIESNIRIETQHYTGFEIVASENISEKASSMDIEASLKASFLGGLVEVGGSAKYLNDSVTSKNQSRVTLKYKTTTEFKQMSSESLHSPFPYSKLGFQSGIATHVVTGITYGAQAYFVFDMENSTSENRKQIEGKMKISVNKIPAIKIEGEGSIGLGEDLKEETKNFSCKFYGDFFLDKNPANFQDAVKVYKDLPNKVKNDGTVPMTAWLLPLSVLDSNAAKLVREISDDLVTDAQKVLEDLNELEQRYNEKLTSFIAKKFPHISKDLRLFKLYCEEYKLRFQKELADILPLIRGGGEDELVLAGILQRKATSPFSHTALTEWLDSKDTEIRIMDANVDAMDENSLLVPTQIEFDKNILSLKTDHAICFAYTSLNISEPYLDKLSKYLRGSTNMQMTSDDIAEIHQKQWYYGNAYTFVRDKISLYDRFVRANKPAKNVQSLITDTPIPGIKGASICIYKHGLLVDQNFEPPSEPDRPVVHLKTSTSITLKFNPPKFGTKNENDRTRISHYCIEYLAREEGDEGKWHHLKAYPPMSTVTNLKPLTEYKFVVRAVCPFGRGPPSKETVYIKTEGGRR